MLSNYVKQKFNVLPRAGCKMVVPNGANATVSEKAKQINLVPHGETLQLECKNGFTPGSDNNNGTHNCLVTNLYDSDPNLFTCNAGK